MIAGLLMIFTASVVPGSSPLAKPRTTTSRSVTTPMTFRAASQTGRKPTLASAITRAACAIVSVSNNISGFVPVSSMHLMQRLPSIL